MLIGNIKVNLIFSLQINENFITEIEQCLEMSKICRNIHLFEATPPYSIHYT